jgi:hypothetical protein
VVNADEPGQTAGCHEIGGLFQSGGYSQPYRIARWSEACASSLGVVVLNSLSKNTNDMSKSKIRFRRPQGVELARRLREPRRYIQVVAGARQVGKTTLVQQVTEEFRTPVRFASADEPTLRGADWISQQWEAFKCREVKGADAEFPSNTVADLKTLTR